MGLSGRKGEKVDKRMRGHDLSLLRVCRWETHRAVAGHPMGKVGRGVWSSSFWQGMPMEIFKYKADVKAVDLGNYN